MLHGILPVLPTPFATDGTADAAAMAKLVAFALEAGAHGLVFPGFASEVELLSAAERAELLGVVVRGVAGRVPVVAGASADSAEAAITHGRAALAAGVRVLMVQAPKSVGTDAATLTQFYGTIAAALPEVEIVLQNAPAPRGSDLSPAAILAIVRAVPAITYVKEETLPAGAAISAILQERPPHLRGVIGGGGARYILDEYARGACGAMPAAELTDLHVALDAAWRAGEVARARQLYMRSLPLLVMQANFRMALTKYVLMRRGVLHNWTARAKLPPMDAIDCAEIDAWLGEIADLLPIRKPVLAP